VNDKSTAAKTRGEIDRELADRIFRRAEQDGVGMRKGVDATKLCPEHAGGAHARWSIGRADARDPVPGSLQQQRNRSAHSTRADEHHNGSSQ
jgi:hypothetical protein